VPIAAPPGEVWRLVVDPVGLASCVPGVREVRAVDERTFEGSIVAAVGPMEGDFTFRAVVAEAEFPEALVVEVTGLDSVTRSRVEGAVRSRLVADGDAASVLEYSADVAVKGRLAILGEMVLRATAGLMIDRLTACLRERAEAAR
jgi:carbon monoxide dehydrogenase subunit G